MSYNEELEFAVEIAKGASQIVMEHYKRGVDVRWKAKNDPVTDADEESTVYLIERIRQKYPDDSILIEEREDDKSRIQTLRTWIIDPLDGTQEFIDNRDEFTVMIGMIERGFPVVGAVALPVQNVVYAGAAGGGVFAYKENFERVPVTRKECNRISEIRLIVSRSHRSTKIDLIKQRLGIQNEIPCGSVGLKMIKVIIGEVDLYIHPGGKLKLWDVCAPNAIANAGGVVFTDVTGMQIDYLSSDYYVRKGVLVAGKELHKKVLEKISDLNFHFTKDTS